MVRVRIGGNNKKGFYSIFPCVDGNFSIGNWDRIPFIMSSRKFYLLYLGKNVQEKNRMVPNETASSPYIDGKHALLL
jgi:hypothetical protein